ncbi:putative bifunctional diguanylate cyclase/phosphodiesterase [Spirilliplanes yamanashiensis]
MPELFILLALALAMVVTNRVRVDVRIGGNKHGMSWSEVPVLVGLVLVPPPWVVLCVVAGVSIGFATARTTAHKAVFGVAKDSLAATTAGAVVLALGLRPDLNAPAFDLVTLAAAFLAMSIVDDLVFFPVVGFASRTSVRAMFLHNLGLRMLGRAIRLAVVLAIVWAIALGRNPSILLLVPPVVFCVHLWHTHRIRTQQERDAWRELAQATDELNVVDLEAVLASAVTRAARLFSADETEIELATGRVVRGSADGVTTGGAVRDGTTVDADLKDHDGSHRIGTLRLRIRGSVALTEFEQYKLQTFASALSTAIRNATAYARLEQIAEENAHAATHDPLTGLANRRALLDRVEQVLAARAGEGITALLLIDLNHFKEVNDTLGHATGDTVLRHVARRLAGAAREHEMVARLGGDEFAVLLTRLSAPAMASHRADALLAALDPIIEVDGMRLTVEASGGIALAPGTGGQDELLRRADIAMYQAKRTGVRTSVYVHAHDTADLGRLVFGGEVSRAVADSDFAVDFQPIVDLNTGEAVAAEAVTRWPDAGELVDQRRLLRTIERSGQLPAFAAAVLEQSLAAARAWGDAGFDLPVALNVAPRSLLDPDYPAVVLDRLAAHGLPPDRLTLELTETLAISQLDTVGRVLRELREAGVRLVLDDFGTGPGSLTLLSRLPVHELKVDPEFVRTVDSAAEVTAVVRSTVDLARSLHLTVVAEGVESEPQRQALWELGCAAGQGRLFARPMPGGKLLAALRRGHDGRPGAFAPTLHDAGAVIRLPQGRRRRGPLPHLPA